MMLTTMIATAMIANVQSAQTDSSSDLRNANKISKDFNDAIGKPRVLAIIAPT